MIPQSLSDKIDAGRVPVSMQLEITRRCNWRCVHCYAIPKDEGVESELSTQQIYDLLDEAWDLGTFMLSITGGEATLRPDFVDIVRYACERGFAVTIFTNASLIDDAMARTLVELGVVEFQVSVLGASPEVHERMAQRRGSHAAVWAGVRALVKAGGNVLLKSSAMRDNAHEIAEIHAQADQLGVGHMTTPVLLPRWPGDPEIDGMRLKGEARKEIIDLQAGWQMALHASEDEHPRSEHEISGASSPGCRSGTSTMSIGGNGKVYPCNTHPADVGDTRERSLKEIWADFSGFSQVMETDDAAMEPGAIADDAFTCPMVTYSARKEARSPASQRVAMGKLSLGARLIRG